MHKNRSKPIFVYLVLGSLLVLPVLAQTGEVLPNNTQKKTTEEMRAEKQKKVEEDKTELKEQKTQMAQEREAVREQKKLEKCEDISGRVGLKVDRYNTNRETYVGKYQRLRERIATWADRLETEGYDTTDLEAALVMLETKIAAVGLEHDNFIVKLENIKNYECGNSAGAYTQALTDSRTAMAGVREEVQDVRKYYIEEVKPLVIELRNLAAQAKEETTESENN